MLIKVGCCSFSQKGKIHAKSLHITISYLHSKIIDNLFARGWQSEVTPLICVSCIESHLSRSIRRVQITFALTSNPGQAIFRIQEEGEGIMAIGCQNHLESVRLSRRKYLIRCSVFSDACYDSPYHSPCHNIQPRPRWQWTGRGAGSPFWPGTLARADGRQETVRRGPESLWKFKSNMR